uniref:Holin n=1 Tax=viral metagenome TaxID=1070528 RepID=A0A6H1ZPI2_9ZZZZ
MEPMTILTLIGTLGGMLIPPIVDFVKKKFIPASNDTPERTMGTLATTKPDVLAAYTESLGKYLDAQTRFFNRDISGVPSLWVINLRAAIRPLSVVGAFLIIGLDTIQWFKVDPSTRAALFVIIGNWLGSRIT